jgi:hypothetical protein
VRAGRRWPPPPAERVALWRGKRAAGARAGPPCPHLPPPASIFPTRARARRQVLSRLTALEVLQLDKREEGDGYSGIALAVTPAVVASLAAGWRALHTLDLFNIGPAELPAEVGGAGRRTRRGAAGDRACGAGRRGTRFTTAAVAAANGRCASAWLAPPKPSPRPPACSPGMPCGTPRRTTSIVSRRPSRPPALLRNPSPLLLRSPRLAARRLPRFPC